MKVWKRVTALFAFSMLAGLLGAGCSTQAQDEPATDDTPAVEDQSADLALTPTAGVDPLGRPGPNPGPGPGSRRCEDRCRDDYARCGRGPSRDPRERERRCHKDLDRCIHDCRFH